MIKPLRFNALPTPICFRLERDGSTNPIPLECPVKRTLIERLSSSDIFWYDDFSRQTRTLTIVQISAPLDFCAAGQPSCEIVYSAPDISVTANPTLTVESIPDLILEATPTMSVQVETGSCGNALPWRLQIGGQGRVSTDESTPSTLRWEPGGQRKGYVQAGESFTVLGGPICTPSNGISWWYIKTAAQVEGWVSEGNDGDYWIEPAP